MHDVVRGTGDAAPGMGPANAAWGKTGLARDYRSQVRNKVLRLLVPPAWLVLSLGGSCDRGAGSKATGGNLGRRRGRLFRAHATRRGSHLRRVRAAQARSDRALPLAARW